MKPTALLQLGRRLPRCTLVTLLALSAAACGPGVGGTGTGAEQPSLAAGFQPAKVCSGALASALDCSSAVPGPSAASPSYFSNGRVSATVQEGRIELLVPCERLVFSGEWGTAGTTEPAFFGQVQSPSVSGVAQLQAEGVGGALLVRLLGPEGQLLLGPVSLPRQKVLQPTDSC